MSQKISLYALAALILFSFLTVSIPQPVQAEDPNVVEWLEDEKPDAEVEETADPVVTEDKSLTVIIGKLVLYTLLILGMIYGLIKFLALRQKKFQPNQAVKLMGGTPLGNNKSLQLVKVGAQVYLIGVGDQVTLIKEISDTDEIQTIEKDLDNQTTILSNPLVGYVKDKLTGRTETKVDSGFNQLFNQSLNKQKIKQDRIAEELGKADEKEGSSS
ncbi:flagellar biosynthetic protein FliO [Planococcus sp. YIM B11945]|uniref:flagellar biosynthetic protein FliO n=1 Tax=Planococcus sp. YIM B11945 TaxID=3435410 RepID=UPI003D7C42A3